ncbi:MAG: alpha-amylase family glycosyl hydrolase, partial [Candidatus Entotheonellia bacterium]
MTDRRVPTSTYRLQCHRGFRVADVRALVPYLHQLGITDVYTSPLLKARTGSLHGYDVTDPLQLNPELGTEEDFDALVRDLTSSAMGLLLDIVPNHMAASLENPWWVDVLTQGPRSPFARYFDIDWHPPSAKGVWDNQVLLPILGQPYGKALEDQELTLSFDDGGFSIRHHAQTLPLAPQSYGRILTHRLDELHRHLGEEHPGVQALEELMATLARLPLWTGSHAAHRDGGREQFEAVRRRLSALCVSFPDIREFLEENVRILNGSKGDPGSFDRLDRLLAGQAYRLAFWRVAQEKINYRRFFDINDLVGMRVEDPQVLEGTHALIFQLIRAGKVTGLRIDHIDGLADPLDYLRRLQGHVAPDTSAQGSAAALYVIVEKILMGDETLPGEWPVSGTTGYD